MGVCMIDTPPTGVTLHGVSPFQCLGLFCGCLGPPSGSVCPPACVADVWSHLQGVCVPLLVRGLFGATFRECVPPCWCGGCLGPPSGSVCPPAGVGVVWGHLEGVCAPLLVWQMFGATLRECVPPCWCGGCLGPPLGSVCPPASVADVWGHLRGVCAPLLVWRLLLTLRLSQAVVAVSEVLHG